MQNIIGKKVKHIKYGIGTIEDIKEDKISIHFDSIDKGQVDFQIPLAFDKSLSTTDKTVINYIQYLSNLKHTCSICGTVNETVKKINNQILCDECYSNAPECIICDMKCIENSHAYQAASMCEKCYKENYFKCTICGNDVEVDFEITDENIPNGERWCSDCSGYCSSCDNIFKHADFIHLKDDYIDLCPSCYKKFTRKCSKCGKTFYQKNTYSDFCKKCVNELDFKEILEKLDLDEYTYVEYYFFELKEARTTHLMSRLNHTTDDDPFDILFIKSYNDEMLVIVSDRSSLCDCKAYSSYFDDCTMTEFKKSNLYYKLFSGENDNELITTLEWSNKYSMIIWKNPVSLRAKTYGDMDYRKEFYAGVLVYEGNNYGDTSDFYIIGKLVPKK